MYCTGQQGFIMSEQLYSSYQIHLLRCLVCDAECHTGTSPPALDPLLLCYQLQFSAPPPILILIVKLRLLADIDYAANTTFPLTSHVTSSAHHIGPLLYV